MIRVTADANIYISAFNFGGAAQRVLDLAESGAIQLLLSEPLIEEIVEVLGRKFDWSTPELRQARHKLRSLAEIVEPIELITAIAEDPDDDRVLECALAGRADFVVTGDRHLLRLGHFRNIPILTVRDFLDRTTIQ